MSDEGIEYIDRDKLSFCLDHWDQLPWSEGRGGAESKAYVQRLLNENMLWLVDTRKR